MPFSFGAGKQPEPAHSAIERVGVKSMNAATNDTRPGATQVRIRPQMASIAGRERCKESARQEQDGVNT